MLLNEFAVDKFLVFLLFDGIKLMGWLAQELLMFTCRVFTGKVPTYLYDYHIL